MTKPTLPSIESASWIRPYKPSGICPPGTIISLIVLGGLTAAAIGVIGFYGGSVTSALAVPAISFGLSAIVVISNLGFCGGCAGKITAFFVAAIIILGVILILGVGYPALLGIGLGYVILMIVRQGKCRNPALVEWVSFLCAVIAYGVFVIMTLKLGGGLHETSYMTKIFKLSSTPWWMYIIVGIDALIVIALGASWAPMMMSTKPFCETCGKWYQEVVSAKYSIDIAEPLQQTLEESAIEKLQEFHIPPYTTNDPYMSLDMQKCSCEQSDFKLSATLRWQEIKVDSKGQSTTETPSELWFTTMVSPSLGKQLEQKLFVKPT